MHGAARKGWEPPRGKAVLSDGALLPNSRPDLGTAVALFCMSEDNQIVKRCPICRVAMVRQNKDDGTILYQCLFCKTEVNIAPATDNRLRSSGPSVAQASCRRLCAVLT
jgi:hypothetical protein